MRYSKWIGLLTAVILVIACVSPWIYIESKSLSISGIDTAGTNFGYPAYFHFVLAGIFLVLTFVPRVWAKRLNLLVTALNLGWALRNFFVISACMGGDCPVKLTGLYGVLLASIFLLLAALFPDMTLPEEKPK